MFSQIVVVKAKTLEKKKQKERCIENKFSGLVASHDDDEHQCVIKIPVDFTSVMGGMFCSHWGWRLHCSIESDKRHLIIMHHGDSFRWNYAVFESCRFKTIEMPNYQKLVISCRRNCGGSFPLFLHVMLWATAWRTTVSGIDDWKTTTRFLGKELAMCVKSFAACGRNTRDGGDILFDMVVDTSKVGNTFSADSKGFVQAQMYFTPFTSTPQHIKERPEKKLKSVHSLPGFLPRYFDSIHGWFSVYGQQESSGGARIEGNTQLHVIRWHKFCWAETEFGLWLGRDIAGTHTETGQRGQGNTGLSFL